MLNFQILTVLQKLGYGLLHNFGRIHALVVVVTLEELELEQLAHVLDATRGLDHKHCNQEIHEALGDFLVSEKLPRVRMVLKEVRIPWLEDQVAEVAIGVDRRVERRSTEGQHEEENAEREDIGGLCLAWHFRCLVYLGGHVHRRAHLLVDVAGQRCSKAKIAKL